MRRYIVETNELFDLLSLLDAVALLIEPEPTHKPSSDTLEFKLDLSKPDFPLINEIRHSRLGLNISVEIA